MKKFKPDIVMAHHYLRKLDQIASKYTFQTFDDDSSRQSKPLAKVLHGTLEEHANELNHLNNCGAGIFAMVNRGDGIIHSGKSTCRTNDSVISVRALFAD